jgi:hypothetical protein
VCWFLRCEEHQTARDPLPNYGNSRYGGDILRHSSALLLGLPRV